MRLLLILAAFIAAGPTAFAADANRGAELYEARCEGCHSLDANRVGPKHRGVFGRKVGSVPDFGYSNAVRNSPVIWDETTLDRWLTNPQAFIAGARMGFRVSEAVDRADLIAYLRRESGK
ncbi:MAG: c-type cytochrome [Alphaproteobacteria bacterium]|nr:c-type cytochrome [Alphaproteobacteria bacterium]